MEFLKSDERFSRKIAPISGFPKENPTKEKEGGDRNVSMSCMKSMSTNLPPTNPSSIKYLGFKQHYHHHIILLAQRIFIQRKNI